MLHTNSTASGSRLKEKDFQTRLTTLTSELELSTFLNKGILQTNSENKIIIAELRQENAILRAAEAKLAETEDLLNEVEKKYKALEDVLEKERAERDRIIGERDLWRGRWEGIKDGWEMVKRGMDEVCKDREIPSSLVRLTLLSGRKLMRSG